MDTGHGRRRVLRRALLRLLAAPLLALLVLLPALGAGPSALTSPALQPASAADPAPPTNVQAVGQDRALAVSWTAPAAETFISGYQVFVDGTLTASPTGTSVTLTGLVNGRGYVITVKTVVTPLFGTATVGQTASAPVTGTPRDSVAPAAPTGVTAVRGDGRVTVSWTADSTDYDADGYRLVRDGVPLGTLISGRNTVSAVDTGLVNDRTYGYAVQTHDTSGNWSASSTPVVNATPTDLTAPAAPTGLVATRGDGRVTLSWTASTETDLASYRVLRDGTEVATVTGATTYTDTGLVNDRSYAYTLVAVDGHGNRSAASAPAVTATPTDLTPPAPPTGLTATRGDGKVTLSWTASTEPDLASYRVLRDGTEITTVTGATTYTDTGLVNDRSYAYTLVAVDTHGNRSAASAPAVTATPTDLTPPAVPSGLVAARGDGRVTLSWTANTEPDLASYRVVRDGLEIATVTSGTSYADTAVVNDNTYGYALVAVDTHGNRSAVTASRSATPTDLTPPAAPTGLTAVRGDGRVDLTWTANTEPDLAYYRLVRDGVEVVTISATATSYADTGLVNDRQYSYRLVAVDGHGNRSLGSATVYPTPTDLTAPAVPTGLAAVRGDSRVTLSWTANSEPDLASYRVLRDGAEVATVTGGTTYTDTGVTNDTTYAYALVAVDTHGNRSAASAAVSATPTDLTAPAAPTGLVAARGDGRVTLSWTANAETDVASYRLLRGGAEIATVTGATSYVDTTVVNDTPYTYALVAVDTHGNRSAASASVSATPTDLTAPAVPSGLVAVRGDGRVDLSWTANTEPDLASYRVLRDGAEVATVPAGTTTWADTAVVNDRGYLYALVAVDTHGNRSAASATVAATPTDLTAPAAPTGLVATRGDGEVTLTWTANTEPDLANYRVLRDGAEVATVTGGTTYTDSGLVNDRSYTYTLVAVDTHGNRSPESAARGATPTDLTAPATPTGLTAARGDGEVTLSWTANSEPDLASYRVLRDGVEVATVTAGTTAWTDTAVVNDTAYGYALVAVDTHGNRSAPTGTVRATPTDLTPPAAPTGLTAQRGDGRVDLTWTANTEADLASYRVLRDGVEVATVTGATTWSDTAVVNDTAYGYALVAVDTHGNRSPATPVRTATPTDLTPPAVPTGFTATAGDGRVDLSWTANGEPDLAGYVLVRDGVELGTVTGTGHADTTVVNDTTYGYALVAVDTHGNRSPATPVRTATPTDRTPPATPAGFSATAGDGRVDLSWTANGEPDLAGYVLVRDGVELGTVTGTGHADTTVVNDTTYGYALIAVDTHGNRSPATPVRTATPTDLTPPATPAGFRVVAGDGRVDLSWTANAEPDLAGYRLTRDGVEIATVTGATTYADTAVVNGTTYAYALVAVDSHGNVSPAAGPVQVTPVADLPPAAPTGVTATPGDGSVLVRWTAVDEADVVGYRVLATDGTVLATAAVPATSATVTGLPNGTPVSLSVVAVDAAGHVSDRSATVTATPKAPGVPTQGAGEAGGVAVSDDGRYAVIGTRARLEAADTNTAYELYLVDRSAGGARRIAPLAAAATGSTDPTNTSAPAVSADGRYVALATTAALVASDTNRLADVYRLDTRTGTWALVSVPAGGGVSSATAGTLLDTGASITATSPTVVSSADGDLVFFYSARSDLTAGDTNGAADLFAKRMSTGVVTRVSTTATGANMTRTPIGPALAVTPDGRFAVFPALNSAGAAVLYRKSLADGGLTVVSSLTVSGRAVEYGVYRDAGDIAVSDDGRYVALATAARLATGSPGTSNSTGQAYRVDATTGATVPLGTGQTTIWEHRVDLDPTGRYGFFQTAAGEVAGDTNGHTDTLRRDLAGGTPGPLLLVTADGSGRATTGPTGAVGAAEYGRVLAVTGDQVFVTTVQPLLATDTNGVRDLYLKDLVTGAVRSPLG